MGTQDTNGLPSSPSYPEMIMAALDSLNEDSGSNKTSISKFIESTYQNLPAGHGTLLKHHLNRLKDCGQLIFLKNNYMKPRPDFIKRGRGRPPKPKDGTATSYDPTKTKIRPRTDEMDSGEPPSKKVTKTGRGRGRPPKAKHLMGGEGVSAQG